MHAMMLQKNAQTS